MLSPPTQLHPSNFTSDYKILINAFQTLSTKPKIFIVLPPPIFNDSLGPNETILVGTVIPLIKQVANETGLPTIDVYTPLLNHSDYFWDGVHPNSIGAEIIATQIYDGIA